MRLRSVITMALACAAGGACSAGGFYADGSTKLGQAFVVGESGGTWKPAQGLPSVATGLNTGGSVPGTGTDDSESLAESCPVPQRGSIGGYVPSGSGREVGFLDDQLRRTTGTRPCRCPAPWATGRRPTA
jgi:hypothetical protein